MNVYFMHNNVCIIPFFHGSGRLHLHGYFYSYGTSIYPRLGPTIWAVDIGIICDLLRPPESKPKSFRVTDCGQIGLYMYMRRTRLPCLHTMFSY